MKYNKTIFTLTILALIVSFAIGFSYAYFTTIVVGNDTASSNIATAGSLKINYVGTDYIDMENTEPGDSSSAIFTVTNSGTLPIASYQIFFSNVINTFHTKSEVVYTINCVSSDAVTCLSKTQTQVPSVPSSGLTQTSIAPGTTHTYTLTVTFIDTDLLQDYNQNKMLTFKITINEQFEFPTLIASTGYSDTRYFWGYKQNITEVTFEDTINVPNGAFASWDVSAPQNGSIMAYIIDDGLGTDTYKLFIQSNVDLILANPNSSYLFYGFAKLKTINNLSLLNTSKVTNMYLMFYNCSSLISLDLSAFDTSQATNMGYMFYNCTALTNLDVSAFDTSQVTSMSEMFSDCSGLTSLDLSAFDTSQVTNMNDMFCNCNALISLDVSTFDTSQVMSMNSMFYSCGSLTSLDLSAFDTSQVTNMRGMFVGCSSLTSLDVSSFDTSQVTDMSWMFRDCRGLTNLDLSGFDTSQVTEMDYMFYYCSSLISIDLRLANFTNVTSYLDMFSYISNGINIIVKDTAAQIFINARLANAGKTGTVVIV